MAGEQQFKVFLSFKDEATGKFIKATEDQINSIKKLGLTVKKEGSSVAVDMDKMGKSMTETGRHSRYLGQEISALAGKIGTIRNMILVWMFALRPLIGLIKESITAARAQEDSERALAAAFAATGAGSRAGANAIIAQANALQQLTGASDNEIIAAAGILATFKLNEQQIQRLLPLMVDMSKLVRSRSGEEMSLASVAKATGQAFSTSASRLEYLGITLDAATKKSKDFDTILKAIEKSVGGAAVAMAGTFSGQLKILAATMGDYRESMGNIITRSPYFIAVMQLMTGEVDRQNKALKESQAQTDNFAEAWRRILAAVIGVWSVLKGVVTAIMQVARIIDVIIIGIAEFLAKILLAVTAIITALVSIVPFSKGIQTQLIKIGDEIEMWQKTFSGANKNLIKDIQAGNKALGETVSGAVDLYSRLLEGAERISAAMKIEIKDLISNLDDLQNSAGNTFNVTQTFMTNAVTGMRDMFVEGFVKIVKGEFEGLSDIVVSFGNLMLKTIMQIIVNATMIRMGLGTFLGLGGGLVLGHTGGYMYPGIEASFGYGRRKFHSGGEVPATLLEGEGVLNRTGMRSLGIDNLNKLNRGEQARGGTTINHYYIQTIDERSFRERLQQHSDIYVNASERGILDNTSLRKTNQRWGS